MRARRNRRLWPKPALLCLIGLWLTGCATAGSDGVKTAAPQARPVAAPRLPLKTYSPEWQAGLADALEATPAGSPLRAATMDYGQLRRAVCAAEGWRQPACLEMRGR
jgi:hypothetical protein